MTAQEKRTKSGEIILTLIQGKPTSLVAEVERKSKLPHEEIVSFFKELESKGEGRFIVGRRGAPSRFVRFVDARREDPQNPLDVKVDLAPDGRVELRFSTSVEKLGELVESLKKAQIKAFAVDISGTTPAVVVMVSTENLNDVLRQMKGMTTN